MKPPICSICNKEVENLKKAGLIYFKKRPSDIEWEKKMKKEGKIGHPPYARWFCENHYKEAEKLRDHNVNEAMKRLNSIFKE